MIFKNRKEAGKLLAKELEEYAKRDDAIVLGLPRGGVPVAAEISKILELPLDAFLVRKLGTPGQEELAMGAIAMGGVKVINENIVQMLRLTEEQIDAVAQAEQVELERRNDAYRGGRPAPEVEGKVVILVDDGLATGATMRAAVEAIKTMGPAKIIIAVPVSPKDTYHEFKKMVDEIDCLSVPESFMAVGQWYEEFGQTSDAEVQEILKND